VVSAAVVALASSSAALFLSSASSESLRVQLAAECPDAAYPVLSQSAFGPGGNGQGDVSRLAPEAMPGQGLAAPYRVLQTDATSVPQRVPTFRFRSSIERAPLIRSR